MKIIRGIFFIIFLICFVLAFLQIKAPETNLLSAFLSSNSKTETNIAKLSQISGNKLNIILESDTQEDAEELKSLVQEQLSELQNQQDDVQEVLEVYKNYSGNFLTTKTRNLLKNKNYEQIEQQSLAQLYNPLGYYIAPLEQDPYLFASEFAMNNQKFDQQENIQFDGKYYNLIRIECKNMETVQKTLSKIDTQDFGQIYLSGAPIHTYETSKRSSFEINIICIISTIMIILLCCYHFKNPKILFPIVLSIFFGILTGFIFTVLFFKQLHILTFVFSTSLIGISFDYSLHYFLSNKDKTLWKSLSVSMFSTVLTFGVLYFSNLEVLKQISVFVSFGLFGVYLFVKLIIPMFNLDYEIRTTNLKLPKISHKTLLAILLVTIIAGFARLQFDDSIKNIYKPTKTLKKAEALYTKVFNSKPINFIIIEGENIDKILEKEEKISQDLDMKNIDYLSLSNFVSSRKKQSENVEFVKELYQNNLGTYAQFLDSNTKTTLLNKDFPIYSPEKFPLNKQFSLNNNTTFMVIFSEVSGIKTINIPTEISKILKNFRHKCMIIIPIIFVLLYAILRIFFNAKQSAKIILSPLLGGIFALTLLSLVGIQINVFHLLAFILIIGFSLDYSIFRTNCGKNSNLAVFISCFSTVFSFLLLSFTGFKLISSLGMTLAIGIFTSYILSLILIPTKSNMQ